MRKSSPAAFSPVPWVNLEKVDVPNSGLLQNTTNFCMRKFGTGGTCKDFYEKILRQNENSPKVTQCPFGFSTRRINLDGTPIALTGFVPYPRAGGNEERQRAKDYPDARIDLDKLERAIGAMNALLEDRSRAIVDEFKLYTSALHEIRKLNRNIKREAEDLSHDRVSQESAFLRESVTSILKSSELMTLQFDILDLIANEQLATLPLKTKCEVYRIFDKCVRIYDQSARARRLDLRLAGCSPRALVCDKTFPILATVLIENAIKYSLEGTVIHIKIESSGETLTVSVSNTAPRAAELPDIFSKGVRGDSDLSGHGFGLHLASLVAKQHKCELRLTRSVISESLEEFRFAFSLPILSTN